MDDVDSIEPAPRGTSATASRRKETEGTLLPKSEYKFEHVKAVLQQIQHLCVARGERIETWMDPIFEIIGQERVDFGKTWDATHVLLDRLMRGEFLLFFSERSGRIDAINPVFEPKHVVVLKGEPDSSINAARRPAVHSTSELVLSRQIYFQAGLPAPANLTREEFGNAINAIAVAFGQLHPESVEVGEVWKHSVLRAGKDVGGTRWNFLGNKSKVMRWKLIVVGEKVRTGEKLPKVEELVNGHIDPPQNVGPSDACFIHSERSHSLGRIGIRQARRIGYIGRAAPDGGLVFL